MRTEDYIRIQEPKGHIEYCPYGSAFSGLITSACALILYNKKNEHLYSSTFHVLYYMFFILFYSEFKEFYKYYNRLTSGSVLGRWPKFQPNYRSGVRP